MAAAEVKSRISTVSSPQAVRCVLESLGKLDAGINCDFTGSADSETHNAFQNPRISQTIHSGCKLITIQEGGRGLAFKDLMLDRVTHIDVLIYAAGALNSRFGTRLRDPKFGA